jgi:hypothetical protein
VSSSDEIVVRLAESGAPKAAITTPRGHRNGLLAALLAPFRDIDERVQWKADARRALRRGRTD